MKTDHFTGWIEKYRATNLNDIIGHERTKKSLAKRIKDNNIPQNILFSGPTGCGKTTFAKLIAKTLHCKSPTVDKYEGIEYFVPCNECVNCRTIHSDNSTSDYHFFDGSSLNKDSVLAIKRICESHPLVAKTKIILIEEIQNIASGKDSSIQALLKLIEKDYGGKVHFIMSTMDISKIHKSVIDRFNIHERLKIVSKDFLPILAHRILESEGLFVDIDFNQVQYATEGFKLFIKEGIQTIVNLNKGSVREFVQALEECVYKNLYSEAEIQEAFQSVDDNTVNVVLYDLLDQKVEGIDALMKMNNEQIKEFFYLATYTLSIAVLKRDMGFEPSEIQNNIASSMIQKYSKKLDVLYNNFVALDRDTTYLKKAFIIHAVWQSYEKVSTDIPRRRKKEV